MFRPILFATLLAAVAHAYAPCNEGQSEMSVEGVEGVFCVTGSPICIADVSDGACPTVQGGLPYGSYCGLVATGVYGCKALDSFQTNQPTRPPPAVTSAPTVDVTSTPPPTASSAPSSTPISQCSGGHYEMSVEGVNGIFCLSEGPICMVELSTGTCPGPQTGLPDGSYCGLVASGVYGCKVGPNPAPSTATAIPTASTSPSAAPAASPMPVQVATISPSSASATDGSQCVDGDYEMSVEGVDGIFCLSKGPICMAEISTGACPGPQYGLPDGSYCGIVASGVFGCKPNAGPSGSSPAPTTATTAANATPLTPGASVRSCANGATPMSVEGVDPIFCVQEPACVADRATGNCPSSQDGLPWGSYCDIITRTGQYGCKPFNGTNVHNSVVYPAVLNCTGNASGDTPVSVVGAGTFCAAQPVCAGAIFGNCPRAQSSLSSDSKCAVISTGVYGCVQLV